MRVEGVYETGRVDGVSECYFALGSARASASFPGGHLSPHVRQDTNTTSTRREAAFQFSARSQKCLPWCRGVDSVERVRRLVRAVDGQDHTDGPSTMGQEIRCARLSHLAQDASGVGLQFSNADALLSPLTSARPGHVVPHVTTLNLVRG